MVMSRRAVERFANREFNDSRIIKRFSKKALQEKMKKYGGLDQFVKPPFKHQLASWFLGTKYNGYLFLLDMGLGKTKIMFDLFRWRYRLFVSKRMLVLVPGQVNVYGWQDEAEIHAPDIKFAPVIGDDQRKWDMVDDPKYQVVCMTYAAFLRLVCVFVRKTKKKRQMAIDPKLLKYYRSLFDTVVFDECDYLRSRDAITFRACRRFADHCSFTYALTGTPFGDDPHDLWSQFRLADGGETFGSDLGLFRDLFFRKVYDHWKTFKYNFDKKQSTLLQRMVRHRSIRYADYECNDLPRCTIVPVTIPMNQEAEDTHASLLLKLRESSGQFGLIDNSYVRLRQLVSGYIVVKVEKEKAVVPFKPNPKLDLLEDLLCMVPPGEKSIVFNWYRDTGAIIEGLLKRMGIKYVRIWSGASNNVKLLDRYNHDPEVQVLLGSKSIVYGANLQIANRMFIYENPSSPKERKQLVKRIDRTGQTKPTFVYDLIMRHSIDQMILNAQKLGKNLFDMIIEGDNVDELRLAKIRY